MTISVQSHDVKADEAVNKPIQAKAETKAEPPKEETASAPEAKAPEQKEVTATSESAATEEVKDETEVSAEASESTEEAEAEGEKLEGKEDKSKGINKRFSKLTKAKVQAEARAMAAEQELNVMRQRLALNQGAGDGTKTAAKEVGQKPAAAAGKPDPNSFESYDAYLDARDAWNQTQWNAKQERDRMANDQAKVQSAYAEKVAAFEKAHPDWQEVMDETTSVTSPIIEQVIMTSDIGPALRYELAKKPDEAMRIAKLPPVAAAKELGKLEDRIISKQSSAPNKETKKTTTAPAPITPVGGGGRATAPPKTLGEAVPSNDISSDNFAAFKRIRDEQLKTNRRRA